MKKHILITVLLLFSMVGISKSQTSTDTIISGRYTTLTTIDTIIKNINTHVYCIKYKQEQTKIHIKELAINIKKINNRIVKLDTIINKYKIQIKQCVELQQEKASSITGLIDDTSMNNWVKMKLAKNINADESINQYINKLSLDVTKFRIEQDSLGIIIHKFKIIKDSVEYINNDEISNCIVKMYKQQSIPIYIKPPFYHKNLKINDKINGDLLILHITIKLDNHVISEKKQFNLINYKINSK